MKNDLTQLTTMIQEYFTPITFMEVGSRDGQDTEYVCKHFNIETKNAYIVEANIFCYQQIQASMISNGKKPFANVIYGACSNKDETVEFNCVISDNKDIVGISSLKKHLNLDLKYHTTKVKAFRLETMLKKTPIDLFKIDVEGHGYEVLEGMGDEITKVKAIQIETEKVPNFENQKLDSDVHDFITSKGFELINKTSCWSSQFDCLYLNKNLL